jgi:hypothetical protein
MLAGFDGPNVQAWMAGCEVESLDDSCTIAKFVEADLCSDDVFFEDL